MRPLDAVRAFLRREEITDAHICCALSGGADSVCLLHCLLHLRETFDLTVSAVHIQHGLRGEESLRDEQFCRIFCTEHGVPLTVIPVDVRGYAAAHRLSEETAARECRYAAFDTLDCTYVATAHTASDQLETILFRMARGTGLRGLCGIPPRRGRFLRPLLCATRGEIEDFLHASVLSYVTDSTNLSDAYSRNFIRHTIVPPLRTLNAGAEHHVLRMAQSLREDADLLDTMADAAYRQALRPDGSLGGAAALHPALRSRVIARFLEENGLPHGSEALAAVQQLLTRGGTCDLDRSGRLLHSSRGILFLQKKMEMPPEIPLQLGENSIFPGICVNAEVIDREDSEKFARIHKKFTDFCLDYDIIKMCVTLHARKPGLRMRPACRMHHVTIKKWLNEQVAPARRQTLHFLSDARGLIWAEDLGAADRVRVTAQTQHMLFLQVHPTHTERT